MDATIDPPATWSAENHLPRQASAGITEMALPRSVDVSVVICAYTLDRRLDLQKAVASVLVQRSPVREVVVVIDHNPDLLRWAEARWGRFGAGDGAGPEVRVVASTGARGLSGARNTGVEGACSPIIAFLDDDAAADGTWIERLVEPYLDPRVVACGGAAVPALSGPRPTWWPVEFDWVVGCSYRGLPVERGRIRNPIGANMSVRRAALVAVGGFQEGIGRVGRRPVGCEETDLCIRLVKRWPDALVIYEPAARVSHTVPEERLSWRYFRSRCYAEGLSKALVAARVGRGAALASERSYVCSVLPSAVARGLLAAGRGEPGGAGRVLAIGAGLLTTTAGYGRGRLTQVRVGRRHRGSAGKTG